jgi:rhodanese-related sulfurtransferase
VVVGQDWFDVVCRGSSTGGERRTRCQPAPASQPNTQTLAWSRHRTACCLPHSPGIKHTPKPAPHTPNTPKENTTTKPTQVQARVPKDTGVIIGCQKGLRSLAAAEQLSRAGYSKVAWINGGFDTARPGDLATTNGRDIRCAGCCWCARACGVSFFGGAGDRLAVCKTQ